jgi:hypothetical protein
MDVVDGTDLMEKGRDEEKIRKWKTKVAKAQFYILKTIDMPVLTHIVSCTSAKEVYEILKSIYQRDTTQQKAHLLQEFYNYKFHKKKDMMKDISGIQNLAHKLNQSKQQVDEEMIITRIMTVLPNEYKYFSSAWDSTSSIERTQDNLIRRLFLEENENQPEDQNQNQNNEEYNGSENEESNVDTDND